MHRGYKFVLLAAVAAGCSADFRGGGDRPDTAANMTATAESPETEVADAAPATPRQLDDDSAAPPETPAVGPQREPKPADDESPNTASDEKSYGFSAEELEALGLSDLVSDAASMADDSAQENPMAGCLQCHVDTEKSYLSSAHHRDAEMGCVDCHGPSEGHVGNENNEVLPDEVFARKNVDRLCSECHDCSRETSRPTSADELPKVCTDCHAAHGFHVARP